MAGGGGRLGCLGALVGRGGIGQEAKGVGTWWYWTGGKRRGDLVEVGVLGLWWDIVVLEQEVKDVESWWEVVVGLGVLVGRNGIATGGQKAMGPWWEVGGGG